MNRTNTNTNEPDNHQNRPVRNTKGLIKDKIAKYIVIFSLVFTLVIVVYLVVFWSITGEAEKASDIFKYMVPVISSWIGTILAYYFNKANFEAANQSVRDMVQTIQPNGPNANTNKLLQDLMIPYDKIPVSDLQKINTTDSTINPEVLKTIKLTDVLKLAEKQLFKQSQIRNRFIFVNNNKQVLFLLYKSTIEEFITYYLQNVPDAEDEADAAAKYNVETLTLYTIYEYGTSIQKTFFDAKKTCYFLPPDAPLSRAKETMSKYPLCYDIFITEGGKNDGMVQGWLTNDIITETM